MKKRTMAEWRELSNQLGDILFNIMAFLMMAVTAMLIIITSIGLLLSIYNLIK